MTAQDAHALIRLMQNLYDPPKAIRGRPDAIKERLRVYLHALEPFDAQVLDKAWLKAAADHRFEQWPDCPDILRAAEHFHALAHPPRKSDDSWVEKATALSDAYTRRYMQTTQAGVRSREAGYERELRAYVTEAAWVQSQFIVGRKDVGFVSGVLFPDRERDKEAEEDWFDRQRAQAESGSIKVSVPKQLLEGWKGESRGRGR